MHVPYEQLLSAPSSSLAGLSDPLVVYNNIWSSDPAQALQPLTHESFVDANGNFLTHDLRKWQPVATVSTHSELRLIFHFMRQSPQPTIITLGMSKPCCWPCTVFLDRLVAAAHVTIVVSSTSAKSSRGWQFPADAPAALQEPIRSDVISRARSRLDAFLYSHEQRRKRHGKDSGSDDDSDSDVEESRIFAAAVRAWWRQH